MGIWFAAPIDQYPDYDRVTTIPTATNVNALYPASNLLTYDPTQATVFTNAGPVITWDFGVQKTWDIVALVYTNLPHDALWALETSNDGSAWSTIFSGQLALAHAISGQATQNRKQMLRRNHCVYSPTNPVTCRYIRITLGAGSTLPSIGRLFVGTKFRPSTQWQYGSSFDFNDLSQRERTDRGALVLAPQTPVPVANVKMDFLTQTEMMDWIWEFNYWRGSAREILACLDDTSGAIKWLQKNLLYATLTEGRRINFEAFNAHSVTWVLESLAA